jgi:hypothetical protein
MPVWTCKQCGAQFGESSAPPSSVDRPVRLSGEKAGNAGSGRGVTWVLSLGNRRQELQGLVAVGDAGPRREAGQALELDQRGRVDGAAGAQDVPGLHRQEIPDGDRNLGEHGEVNQVVDIETPILGPRKLYAFNDGPAFVTAEHPFMTRAGWKSIHPEATKAENDYFSVGTLKVGDDMVRLDLQYAREWSLWLDIKILLETPKAVLMGDGAY